MLMLSPVFSLAFAERITESLVSVFTLVSQVCGIPTGGSLIKSGFMISGPLYNQLSICPIGRSTRSKHMHL